MPSDQTMTLQSTPTDKPLRVALAGNPNSGKTSLFNAVTGSNYKVANYPGVTVEKKEGPFCLINAGEITLVDLPGIYSLTGISHDERIAAEELLGILNNSHFDAIISVVDASNLERNLYLTTQLIDLGLPVIIALNMQDIASEHGIKVRTEIMRRKLNAPVVSVNARQKSGISALLIEVEKALLSKAPTGFPLVWAEGSKEYVKTACNLGKEALEIIGRDDETPLHESAYTLYGSGLIAESFQADTPEIAKLRLAAQYTLEAHGLEPTHFEPTNRYRYINGIVKACSSLSNIKPTLGRRIDPWLTHGIWGSVIFLAIVGFVFQSIFLWADAPMTAIDNLIASFSAALADYLPPGKLRSLIIDGVIAGVGSVVIFVPQIAILFFFLGLLEDSGYLTRAAFLMDRIMRHFGLQGRSFIPMLSSFACAIPGIMATRTIPSFADRLATIMVAPLMSCAARLPVYTVLIAAFVPEHYYLGFVSRQGLVLFGLYLLGIIGAALVAFVLKKTLLRGEPSIFVMELPPFRRPSFRLVLRDVWDRVKVFLKDAGTIIFACSVILWALATYPEGEMRDTYAGKLGRTIEPVVEPLGYNWEIGVGLIASFAAREVFISSLATIYNLENEEDTATLISTLKKREAAGTFTLPVAVSLLLFYVFACQCMATVAVVKRETSWRWAAFLMVYMTSLAYITAFMGFRITSWWVA